MIHLKKFALLFIFLASSAAGQADSPAWKVRSVSLDPGGEFRNLHAMVTGPGSQKEHSIAALVPLRAIRSDVVIGDKWVAIGDAGNAQAVVVFDLRRRLEVDWFYCFIPQIVAERWVAYVEWYPRYAPPSSDVVLLYDVSSSPEANRTNKGDPPSIPMKATDAPVKVGIPVFPPRNALARSYSFGPEASSNPRRLIVPNTFLITQRGELVFVAYSGSEIGDSQDFLVKSDFSKHVPAFWRMAIPTTTLQRSGEHPAFIRVEGLRQAAGTKVVLLVPRSEYGVAMIEVDTAKGAWIKMEGSNIEQ